jgi:hypothetical protein
MPLRGNPEPPHRSTIPGAPWVVREVLDEFTDEERKERM